jgi:hypothetical protein
MHYKKDIIKNKTYPDKFVQPISSRILPSGFNGMYNVEETWVFVGACILQAVL